MVKQTRGKNHGFSKTCLYGVWLSMRRRCDNPNVSQYKNYGARGIKVCAEWDEDFLAFRSWALSNGYEENAEYGKCTIDRINNDGNYEPSNCRWVSMKKQQNNRRSNHIIVSNGESHTLSEWEDSSGIRQLTIRARVQSGWNATEATTTRPFSSKTITYNGQSHSVKEWANILHININTLYRRIQKGWSDDKVIGTPLRGCCNG